MECPHLKSITKTNNPFIKEGLVVTNFECSSKTFLFNFFLNFDLIDLFFWKACRSKRDIWMCVECGIINCGRLVFSISYLLFFFGIRFLFFVLSAMKTAMH